MRILQLPVLVLLAAACARGDAATSRGRVVTDSVGGVPRTTTEIPVGWSDTNGWKLVEVARITGGTDGPEELIDPQDIAIGSDGSIYIAENSPAVVKKFSPTGTFIRLIGHEGQGPGEFQVAFIAARGASLFVHDPRTQRTSLFDTAGTYIRSWPSVCCFYGPFPMDSAGNVGVSTMAQHVGADDAPQPYDHLVRWYAADSTLVDSTLIPMGPERKWWTITSGSGKNKNMMSTGIPWMPRQVTTFLPDRRLLIGYSSGYTIAVTDRKGVDTTALFGRSWTPVPIPDETRAGEVERRIAQSSKYIDERAVRNAFRLSDVPTTAPAFDWIDLDARGDTWVRTPLPTDSTRTLFDVFDPQLRWLGQVSGSGFLREWRMKLAGDHMAGFGEDGDGNPVVVVYKIER